MESVSVRGLENCGTGLAPLPFEGVEVWTRSFETPEENLACDEALLDWAEAEAESGTKRGWLRLWESPRYFVTLGYSKPLAAEVEEEACRRKGIPVLRRCTGGGTVLQGPGCFNYALILPIGAASELESITSTNCFVMQRQRAALSKAIGQAVQVQGHTDLTLNGVKFSGNAQRRKRLCLLFHGSFLLDFDLSLIAETLKAPAQQPEYRAQRSHLHFLTNIRLPRDKLVEALREVWHGSPGNFPVTAIEPRMNALIAERYSRDDWNRRF